MSNDVDRQDASADADDDQIAELAAQAGRAAHERALAQTGRVVMRSARGMLVERHATA